MTAALQPSVESMREKWRLCLVIGFSTGILSGLLGIGGAAILIPGMVEVLRISQHKAHGTSLMVMIPVATLAAAVYALNGEMHWPLVALFSVASMAGAVAGARLMSRIPAPTLKKLFGFFLLFVSLRMIIPIGTPAAGGAVDMSDPFSLSGQALLGLFAGVMSGLLGIGGGQILIPGMVFLFQIDQRLAQGISLAFIVPTAIAGSLTHYRRGNVVPEAGLLLIPGALIGSLIGAGVAQQLPGDVLKQIFGVFLLYVGVRMIWPTFWGRTIAFVTRRG
jgi:uncharacterized protein